MAALQYISTSWANDLVLNTLDNNLPNNPNPTRYTWLSAFNLRYQWKGLTATGTLVHTLIAEDVKSGNRPDNRSRFSPTLSFIYRPWEKYSLFLRLMYKTLSAYQLSMTFIINVWAILTYDLKRHANTI